MKNQIAVTAEKCSGCRVCQLMCSMTHHAGAFNPRRALIRVDINRNPNLDTPVAMIDVPRVCRQCEPAPCAESCPAEAFENAAENGVWGINRDICTGCGACKDACPFDMIVFHDETAMKCDLCDGDPVCVRFCPMNALALGGEPV